MHAVADPGGAALGVQVHMMGEKGRDLSGGEIEAMSEEQRSQLLNVAKKL